MSHKNHPGESKYEILVKILQGSLILWSLLLTNNNVNLAENLIFIMHLCTIVVGSMELMVRIDHGSDSSSASDCLFIFEEV